MEGFTFFDIFAHKGVDYLLAVISLLFLIRFWKLLSEAAKPPVKEE